MLQILIIAFNPVSSLLYVWIPYWIGMSPDITKPAEILGLFSLFSFFLSQGL